MLNHRVTGRLTNWVTKLYARVCDKPIVHVTRANLAKLPQMILSEDSMQYRCCEQHSYAYICWVL